jgi:hypothetical protein
MLSTHHLDLAGAFGHQLLRVRVLAFELLQAMHIVQDGPNPGIIARARCAHLLAKRDAKSIASPR